MNNNIPSCAFEKSMAIFYTLYRIDDILTYDVSLMYEPFLIDHLKITFINTPIFVRVFIQNALIIYYK